MQAGDLLGDRFEIDALAGAGGMGQVFRARDRATGEPVAVKVLAPGPSQARFEREVAALTEVRHPAIVRYVAHGKTPAGAGFLVMEWLEGEDLASVLLRRRLTVAETAALGSRVAEALAEAHFRGIVHRDLKPANLLLVGGQIARAKVLDFGIARVGGWAPMTQTGMVLGTPGYMAPEQARGAAGVDARSDVFALGCVLFECLAGAAPFTGDHVLGVLAKILFADPPHLADLCPEAPPALDALIRRMLAKDPADRPRNGGEVGAAIAAIDVRSGGAPSTRSHAAPAWSGGERRLLSVVLVSGPTAREIAEAPTLAEVTVASAGDALREIAEAHGGRLEILADGAAVVTIAGSGPPTDQAAQAARCALSLRAVTPGRSTVLATGRGEVGGRLPAGDAIDRAVRTLLQPPPMGRAIPVDELTAGLLDGRFDVREGRSGAELHGERELPVNVRTLLGRPTTCVGRERELSMTTAILAECVEGPAAHGVLVTAVAGMGKSRLVHEILHAVRERGEGPVEIWIGRGDSMRAGSAFGLLGQALRGAAGIRDGEPLQARRDKLRARVARHVAEPHRARITELLGELVGAPFPTRRAPRCAPRGRTRSS